MEVHKWNSKDLFFLSAHTIEWGKGFWRNRNLRYGYELPLSLPLPEYCVYATLTVGGAGGWCVDGTGRRVLLVLLLM